MNSEEFAMFHHIVGAKAKVCGFFRSRLFVAVLLMAVCAVSVLMVASRTSRVTVVDGDRAVTLLTMKTTNEEILSQAGVSLERNDKVVESGREGNAFTLQVNRAIPVQVTVDGEETEVVLYRGTVQDALSAAGVDVSETDLCNLSLDASLEKGMDISIDRVEYRDVTTVEKIPYGEERRESNQVLKGKEKIYLYGMQGERTIVTREKLVNGQVVETTLVSDEVTKEPVDKIVLVGTKVITKPAISSGGAGNSAVVGSGRVPTSASWRAQVSGDTLIDHEGNEVSYSTYLEGKATAYYAAPGAGTASGRKAQYGVVAVNPNVIPYGTQLYICSADGKLVYGYAVAGDTGGTLMKGSVLVDLYYNNIDQCYWFGSKRMRVYILN